MYQKRTGTTYRDKKGRDNQKTGNQFQKKRRCRLCHERVDYVDYKDVEMLQRISRGHTKITARKRSGVCAHHQRLLQQAIKRARIMALIPFVG